MDARTGHLKLKAPAIRANPTQTVRLKAAYAVSYSPSSQAIRELSHQTGLPEKWISNWFGRQRSKSRKAGEVIDMTASSSASTDTINFTFKREDLPAQSSTLDVVTFKTEHAEVQLENEPPSSPHSTAQDIPFSNRKTTRPTRRRAPRTRRPRAQNQKTVVKQETQELLLTKASPTVTPGQPPQLLPSVATSYTTRGRTRNALIQSRLPVPPPTRSRMPLEPGLYRIQPKIGNDHSTNVPTAQIYTSSGYLLGAPANGQQLIVPHRQQRPIMRADFRHSVPNDYCSDSGPADALSPCPKDLDLSQWPSSPASSETRNPSSRSQSIVPSTALYDPLALIAQGTLSGQQAPLNLSLQAMMGLYNDNPAYHSAMLLNYASLLPTLFPALTGAVVGSTSQNLEAHPQAHPPTHPSAGRYHPAEVLPTDSPKLPAYTIDDPPSPCANPSAVEGETLATPWNSGSNYLDFSGLHYDYAPLSHLQERLEPFRLPESTYLFGREAVVNHLLDDQLAVEEPFQAAMGLVLLSKLGLEW